MLFTYININPMNHHVCWWISPPRTSKLQRSSKTQRRAIEFHLQQLYWNRCSSGVMLLPHRVTKLAAKNRSSRRIWRYCVFMVFKVVLWLFHDYFLPVWWESLSLFSSSPHLLLVLNRELQISVGTAGPQLRVPELSGHCRTNREYQSHSSGRCRISTATAKSQWALPDLNRERQIYNFQNFPPPLYFVPQSDVRFHGKNLSNIMCDMLSKQPHELRYHLPSSKGASYKGGQPAGPKEPQQHMHCRMGALPPNKLLYWYLWPIPSVTKSSQNRRPIFSQYPRKKSSNLATSGPPQRASLDI